MGYVCCIIIGGNFAYNLTGILFNILKEKINSCKMCRHKRLLRQQRKSNRERFGRRKRLIKIDDKHAMIEEVEFNEYVPPEDEGEALIN